MGDVSGDSSEVPGDTLSAPADSTKVDLENNEVKLDSKADITEADVNSTEKEDEPDKAEDKKEIEPSEVYSMQKEDDLESEVYNLTDDVEPSNEDEIIDEEVSQASRERGQKRPMAVITIDSDSDDSSVCHVNSYQATASEAKKIRRGYSTSESESDSSSDESDYESDDASIIKESPSQYSINAGNFKKAPSNVEIALNECFLSEQLNEEFLSHWSKGEAFNCKNLTLHNDPFQICILENFLGNSDAISNIIDDMNTLGWSRRIMDLYEFHRTADLSDLKWQRNIKSIYELLKDNVMKWVARITNTNLTHISASCALYGPGDHLLVHDDLLEDRKIAFIFYLSPWNLSHLKSSEEDADSGWLKSMGGELELLSTDEKGQPSTVVKSIVPQNNSFAFFKVNNKSFHRVAEVTDYDYPRLTINGWFHGPIDPEEPRTEPEVETPDVENEPNTEPDKVEEWVTAIYLQSKCKQQIVQKFGETSEISLVNYFIQQKYDRVLTSLRSDSLAWKDCGPINLRNYQIVSDIPSDEALTPLTDLKNVLTCSGFLTLLQSYTGLPVHKYCRFEIQRWTSGNYTVLPIKQEFSKSEVDVIIYLGCPDRFIKGGTITYLLPEEADADPVISVGLKNNALNIVHSEAGLARFTKYVSKLSLKEGEYFYMLVCSYRPPDAN